jgi:hypothetical protein
MDIAAWLHRLGLEQYEQAFRHNDIDGEVLPDLTADDLISIGVTSVGHRRKLLAAIAALGAELTAVTATSPGAPAQAEAQRRQHALPAARAAAGAGIEIKVLESAKFG